MRTISTLLFSAAFAFTAAAQEPPIVADPLESQPAASIVGTWIGIVDQHYAGSYPAVMRLTSEAGGVSDYASFPCSGKLSRIKDRSGFVFEETITYTEEEPDDGGCIDGFITMEVIDDEMAWTWHGAEPYENTIAIGTFYRVVDTSKIAEPAE